MPHSPCVILDGPPGTGKTLLAKAVAGEAGVPFISISGSEFVEMFVGVGASRVRDIFGQAKKNAPCIIFIDEIDAVGRQRGSGMSGGNDEREQTINQILVEMDGFSGNPGVITIAATNRLDILDQALLRPGRFDRKVTVDLPDFKGRTRILGVHSRGKPLEPDVDLEAISRRTPGFSGAQLENLMNEAAISAARKAKNTIGWEEIDGAVDRIMVGLEKKGGNQVAKQKELVAYHEAGHALCGEYASAIGCHRILNSDLPLLNSDLPLNVAVVSIYRSSCSRLRSSSKDFYHPTFEWCGRSNILCPSRSAS